MADRKSKLELTWIGKEIRPKLEPRILLEYREKSCHAAHRKATTCSDLGLAAMRQRG